MNVHVTYRIHKTPQIDKEINHFLEKLRRRVQIFRPELVHLKGLVEQNSPREGVTVSLNLRLPSGQMAVQQSAPTPTAACKSAFDDILQQLTKHKDLLRNPHKWSRRRSSHTHAEAQVPFESTLAAVQPLRVSSDDIRSYVNANLIRLERFVERELFFRKAAEQIAGDAVSKEEVVDEAIARALGDGGEKPERMALEPWLYHLAIRAMDDLSLGDGDGSPEVHLADSARKPNVRASDEAELQYHQPDEMLTEENVIADTRTATPEDIASSDEMIALVQFALNGANRADREAFILHALEGFSVEEVAAITGHTAECVHASIVSARARVRQSPPLAGRVYKGTLPKTASA